MNNYHADFFDLVLILVLMTQLFLFMENWFKFFKVNYIANIVNTPYNVSYKANMIW